MLKQLFWTYLKIGAFTIGGGYVMLAYVQKEIVDKRGWINEEDFFNMVALAQATPGLIAVNTAIFVGWCIANNTPIPEGKSIFYLHGRTMLYIAAAVSGAVLPSFIIILLIAIYFDSYRQTPAVEAIFRGMRPAVVGLMAATVIHLARKI